MENLTPLSAPAWPTAAGQDAVRPPVLPESGQQFATLVGELQQSQASPTYMVGNGDTLTGIVQQLAQQRQTSLNGEQRHRLALELAARNQISNPNRIHPGQTLRTDKLYAAFEQIRSTAVATSATAATSAPPSPAPKTQSLPLPSTQEWLSRRRHFTPPSPASLALLSPQTQRAIPSYNSGLPAGQNPVLQQTLDRAVQRGFIPAQEKQAVQNKIVQLAQKYHFAPDDFARMTLMESDGMNPRATNQRCHGIIQFCDGPNRGAATVGMERQPKAILGMSVYQQLSLVDTYFQEAGLGKQGPASLDDLYLTVLQPAARQEKQTHVPLNIPPQARDLHPGADTSQAITRQSIVQGLLKITRDKLGQLLHNSPTGPTSGAQVSQATTESLRQTR